MNFYTNKLDHIYDLVLKKLNNEGKWIIHHCSMCGYPCGYLIYAGELSYDSGCDCVTYGPVIRKTDEDDFKEFLRVNMDNQKFINSLSEYDTPQKIGEDYED